MNVRFLESFVCVAKLGSFKAAADMLHTTAAAVASRIATLEEQFGVRLFERDHRGVLLTRSGTELVPYAEKMIELQTRMFNAIGDPDAFSGMLRIGVIETVAHTWLPDLLSRFAKKYPRATLEIGSDLTPRLRDDLLRGTLDFAILSDEITPGFIENRRIANLAMRWVGSPSLARQFPAGAPLGFQDLAKHPIISFYRESGVYRNIAQSAGASIDLRISFFSSIGAMIDMARSGFGSSLLPVAVMQQDLLDGRLVPLDVTPAPAALPLVASFRMEPASPLAEASSQKVGAAPKNFWFAAACHRGNTSPGVQHHFRRVPR
jgi:DNA-binding transcriptional LysR family regulator